MQTDGLSEFQRNLVLSVFPKGSQIAAAQHFQREYLPSPMRVRVSLPDGGTHSVVLRLSRRMHGVEIEARVLPVLSRLGLQVPRVLAGPSVDPSGESPGTMTVLSLLPGRDLQTWSCSSSAGLETAGKLVLEAVNRLHDLTGPLGEEGIAAELPHTTMMDELDDLTSRESPWVHEPMFMDVIHHLKPIVASIQTPLCFSNGDYQPGNFLSDGKHLTGFVDFENACFEDPHISFAKYRIYDLHPLSRTGLVERYLQIQGLSERDFAPRMAVRCPWTLQREVPVSKKDEAYGTHILRLLDTALELLNE
jgi:aminoglycoside phosphotransferase